MKKRGFTLIELIVVIAIIAILASIVAPNAFKAIIKAKVSATVADFQSIKTAAMSYYADTGNWVATCATSPCDAGFVSTVAGVIGWDGPYIEKWPPMDKWAGTYTWTNASGSVFCAVATSAAANERYVSISNVPRTSAVELDRRIDGAANAAAGGVRYPAAGDPVTMNVLVSRDGPTD